jgi:hypothetical protein
MPIDPTQTVLQSAGGDFFLTLFGLLFMFVLGLCSWLVYRMPKEWEASTNRIVAKLCDIMKNQEELTKCYRDHDAQAKEILKLNEKIEADLDRRPCANGKK